MINIRGNSSGLLLPPSLLTLVAQKSGLVGKSTHSVILSELFKNLSPFTLSEGDLNVINVTLTLRQFKVDLHQGFRNV